MGKPIKIRAKVKDGIAQVKALMPHPMESGVRRDAETNEVIPAHYITDVECVHNGEVVMTAFWGPAISKNPYVSFEFKNANPGDPIKISWKDNQGDSTVTEGTLK